MRTAICSKRTAFASTEERTRILGMLDYAYLTENGLEEVAIGGTLNVK